MTGIYIGVDLNPLAVELAKVSLWLETLARDRPLTFLDAHLRCGNSLIGAPLRDDGQFSVERITVIPDEALKEVSKEATAAQKAAARERIKRNRTERARAGRGDTPQMGMWDQQYADAIQAALADTLSRRLDLETSDEDLPMHEAVELVQEKEHLFDELQHAADSRYRQAKKVCDLWCATWFWPTDGDTERGRGGDTETVPASPPPPTTQVFLELAAHILGTDPGSLTDAERGAYLRTAERVAREQRFFHWERACRCNASVPYYLTGTLNSFTIDFLIRMKVKLNLSLFFLETLPIPRQGKQIPRIAELSHALVWNPAYATNLPQLNSNPARAIIQDAERAQLRAEIDALVADLYGLSEEDFAYILTTFPLLDRDQPALPGEPKSTITRDLALLALFKLRSVTPPADIVDFFAAAGADISSITGPLRDLEQRVVEAARLGAVAYIPSGRGGEVEVEPQEAEGQLALFED